MRCPVDGETLLMSDRNGVEIDYCPRCRGVWLDRGELDKIIERDTGRGYAPAARQATSANALPLPREEVRRHRENGKSRKENRRKQRKDIYRSGRTKSFLKEIFDLD